MEGVCAESSSANQGRGAHGEPVCSGALHHQDARRFCTRQGARICTAAELNADVAKGSGCGLDGKRVWASNFCGEGGDHFLSVAGSTATGDELPATCLHWETWLPVRCCADVHSLTAPPALSTPPSPSPLPHYHPSTSDILIPPPPPSPMCTEKYQNCYTSRCCTPPGFSCFRKYANIRYAQCRSSCSISEGWACIILTPDGEGIGKMGDVDSRDDGTAEPSFPSEPQHSFTRVPAPINPETRLWSPPSMPSSNPMSGSRQSVFTHSDGVARTDRTLAVFVLLSTVLTMGWIAYVGVGRALRCLHDGLRRSHLATKPSLTHAAPFGGNSRAHWTKIPLHSNALTDADAPAVELGLPCPDLLPGTR